MSTPLAPLSPMALNARTPETASRSIKFKSPTLSATPVARTTKVDDEDEINWDDPASSPFVTNIDQEVVSAAVGSANGSSPSSQRSPTKIALPDSDDDLTTTSVKSAKGPKAFEILEDRESVETTPKSAVKPASPIKPSVIRPTFNEALPSSGATSRLTEENPRGRKSPPGAADAAENIHNQTIFDESEFLDNTTLNVNDEANIDDTCFSAFSEVPNTDMTMFAKLGQRSPTKQLGFDSIRTPRSTTGRTPGTSRRDRYADSERSPSPTPRRQPFPPGAGGDTTNLLIDFTQQIEAFSTTSQRSPTRRPRSSPSKSQTEPNLLAYINNQRSPGKSAAPPATPARNKNILSLLDFELPPAPTPRSVPSITIRELESLKSSYLSQISSLKATLSGKEAEIESLKKAVGDAERRVGEALESVREERAAREHAEQEKAEWERRGAEVEEVLRSIKEEVISSDKERDELVRKLDESERRVEEAEVRAVDAETRAAEAKSKVVSFAPSENAPPAAAGGSQAQAPPPGMYTAEQVQRQIDEKIHTLSTELHAIYKKKHVTKVAGLKKGFEAKAKERAAELQRQVDELARRNEELQAIANGSGSGAVATAAAAPNARLTAEHEANLKRLEEQKAEIEEQRARLAGLAGEVASVRREHTQLLRELERERVEKGELVAAVDEMLALQSEVGAPAAAVEDLRKSISRPSGLRGPGFGAGAGAESRIGRVGGMAGLGRSVSGGKSRMMSNIERMGGRAVD